MFAPWFEQPESKTEPSEPFGSCDLEQSAVHRKDPALKQWFLDHDLFPQREVESPDTNERS